ncbi:radical SAM protein [Dysgonomonas sp. GY75]|uniref:radical SAM protein n=1 Tax=Dysgonomonas sp. GY75 TaxID=2780419 RepID=UPI00188448BF|nr:radical SAM protein [Dysgonomonas sp. GY75]MBF0650787.1 radical SAM protein [Dysgonomonas sp. GY75]
MKLEIERLSIEITRRCNMRCSHCLRGSSQNIDIKTEYIENILRHSKRVGHLTITGGEPSMNVSAIKFILTRLKRRKIQVDGFYIVTNGSKTSMSGDFIEICKKLYACQNNESCPEEWDCMLEISNDRFHDCTYRDEVYEKLSTYPFFSNRYRLSNTGGVPLLRQGRSKEGFEPILNTIGLDDEGLNGDVYLNALGYLVKSCNLSYRNQQKHIICHSKDFINYLKLTQIKNKKNENKKILSLVRTSVV